MGSLTVYKESASFRISEYAAFGLKRNGALTRIEAPLKFAVFDSKIYRFNGGIGYDEVATRPMRQDSRDNLLQTIRQHAPFWTANQIYTPQNIEGFIRLQSRGDELPDISRSNLTQPGWFIIFPREDLDRTLYLISRGDHGFLNNGRITAGFMMFQPDLTVERINWTRDIRRSASFKFVTLSETNARPMWR